MQREDQYQEFVKKLKIAQQGNSTDQTLKQLSEKADYMLKYMKEHMPPGKYTVLIWLLMAPFMLISVYSFWSLGSIWRLAPIVACILYLLYSRLKVVRAVKAHSYDRLKDDESLDGFRYVEGKVDYVKNGIQVKRQRIQQVMYLFMLFFPFLLYFTYELLSHTVPFNNVWVGILIAFLIGSYIWKFAFSEDLEELNYFENSLESDLQLLRHRA